MNEESCGVYRKPTDCEHWGAERAAQRGVINTLPCSPGRVEYSRISIGEHAMIRIGVDCGQIQNLPTDLF